MSELLNGGCRAGRPRRKHAGRKRCALLMLLAMCLAAACAWEISFVFGGPSSRLEEFPRRSQELIVAPLYQNPEFPSGCEAFSLAMCLRSMGYSVEPSALIDTYMPTDPTWSDFVNHFAGDVRSSGSAMPPAVVVCADAYAAAVDAPLHGVELTGCSFDEVATVVERGYPVLTWITTDFESPRFSTTGTHRSPSSHFMRSARNSIHHVRHPPYRVQWTKTFKCVRDTTRTIKRGARAQHICLPVMLARQAVGHYFFDLQLSQVKSVRKEFESMSSPKAVIMDDTAINRAITRIAHEIVEKNEGVEDLALVGIVTRGDLLAKKLVDEIERIEGVRVPLGSLDISFYRDDYLTNFAPAVHATDIAFNLDAKRIVLVDDILYTGRTIRAALDAIMDLGRPSRVELAVLVDRGHRELPICPDFVGKNVPSSHEENVRLYLEEVDGRSAVEIFDVAPGGHVGSAPLGGE